MKDPLPVAGSQVGHYKLLREVAKGPLGKLYELRPEDEPSGLGGLGRIVPLSSELPAEVTQAISATAWDSMEIRHDFALCVADVVFGEGWFALIHDHAEGTLLRSLQKRTKERQSAFPIHVAVRIALDTLEGVEKSRSDCETAQITWIPGGTTANSLFLCGDGRTRALDGQLMATLLRKKQLHTIAQALGFPAPELLDATQEPDDRTDVFALGALLWELLSGRELALDNTIAQGLRARTKVPSISLSIPKGEKPIPLGLAKVITAALELERANRLATLGEFKATLLALPEIASYAQVIEYVDGLLHRESTLFRLDLEPAPKLSAQRTSLRVKQAPPKPKQPEFLLDLAKQAQARETPVPELATHSKSATAITTTTKPATSISKPTISKPTTSGTTTAKPATSVSRPTISKPATSVSKPTISKPATSIPTTATLAVDSTSPSLPNHANVGSKPARMQLDWLTEEKANPYPTSAEAPDPTEPSTSTGASAVSTLIAETVTQAKPVAAPPQTPNDYPGLSIAAALSAPIESRSISASLPNATGVKPQLRDKRVFQLSLPILFGVVGLAVVMAVLVTAFVITSVSRSSTAPSASIPQSPPKTTAPPPQPVVIPPPTPTVATNEPPATVAPDPSSPPRAKASTSVVTKTPLPAPLRPTAKPTVNGSSPSIRKVVPKKKRQYVPTEL